MQIKNHKLVDADFSNKSPNKRKGKMKPIGIVLHYTASGGKDGGGDAAYLSRASSRASAQIVVGREGDVHQLMPLNNIAWHAGESKWNGVEDQNAHTIGIEIDNWGWLEGRRINLPEEKIFVGQRNNRGHNQWETYAEAQLQAVEEVIAAICDYYDIEYIVGHEDVSPGRKQDPGPALDEFKAKMQEKYLSAPACDSEPEAEPEPAKSEGEVTTKVALRLRKTASYSAPILTVMPEGRSVEVLSEPFPGWFKVKFGNRIGFTVGKYLDM